MRNSRLPRLIALLLLGATVLVGCGSDDSDDSETTSTSQQSDRDVATSDKTREKVEPKTSGQGSGDADGSGGTVKGPKKNKDDDGTKTGDEDGSDDDDTDDGGQDTEAGNGTYCGEVKAFTDELASLQDDTPSADMIEAVAMGAGNIAETAPGDIRKDWQSLADSLDEMVEVIEESGIDLDNPKSMKDLTPAQSKKLRELTTIGQEIQPASERIEKHVKSECGISLS